jgi:hypothetical protein
MNLLKSLLLEEEQKTKCLVCYSDLANKDLFLEINDKKVYFCSKGCKVEWEMKNK